MSSADDILAERVAVNPMWLGWQVLKLYYLNSVFFTYTEGAALLLLLVLHLNASKILRSGC